jgi:trk system potassium uptake protein TrkA
MSRRRVAIAGAGKVGRSIAAELLENGQRVLLIERDPQKIRTDALPSAEWLQADACELSALDAAGLADCEVMVAATGDDKVNLVVSLLAKTEFGVPRVVARVNHPKNEWLFTDAWGVDVAVSAPRLLTALVEEAVSVGDLVRLMKFRQSDASLVELTLPDDSPVVGRPIGEVSLPADSALVVILREGRALVPSPDGTLEGGDEVLAVVTTPEAEDELAAVLGASPSSRQLPISGSGDAG